MDYTAYRREIQRLYEEHPLFEPKLDISVSELEDLTAEALLLPSMLQEIDPLGFFELGNLLDKALRMRVDGSARSVRPRHHNANFSIIPGLNPETGEFFVCHTAPSSRSLHDVKAIEIIVA